MNSYRSSSSSSSTLNWLTTPPPMAAPLSRSRRPAVKVACEPCRQRRIKCDDRRPKCGPCARRGDTCVYGSDDKESSINALKRRIAYLQNENLRYRDLVGVLRSWTESEAFEIFTRLRAAEDPLRVLDTVREAEIILPTPGFTGRPSDRELLELEQEAKENSAIKVPARPWTSVAGDGLVSELISDYFVWDNAYFFPSIDRKVFTEQMRKGDVDVASWCTPLLVSSICAHRSQTLGRAKIYSSTIRESLVEKFLAEAGSWIEYERGRASIPTAQALMLRYFTLTCMGKDRIGRVYRQQALEMVERLDLQAKYNSITGTSPYALAEKRRISKSLWGLFLVESRFAYFYLQTSQIPPPGVPHSFDDLEGDEPDTSGNTDVLGQPFEGSSCEVPLTAGIISPMCVLSELFFEVMTHNANEGIVRGSASDIRTRTRFYSDLQRLDENLPDRLLASHNGSPSTYYLRMHMNEVAFAIIQNQQHNTSFQILRVPSNVTIKDLCLEHCRSDIESSRSFLSHWPFEACLWRHLYMSMQPLVLMLDNSEGRQLFTVACTIMRSGYGSFRLCGHLLQATLAFADAIGKQVPPEALPQFEGCKETLQTHNLPLSFALPRQDDVTNLLRGRHGSTRRANLTEDDLGTLIETLDSQ